MTRRSPPFDVLVLAGSRGPDDVVAAHAGVSCKAMVPVAGRVMLGHVLSALNGSGCAGRITVALDSEIPVADEAPEIAAAFADTRLTRLTPSASPCQTVRTAFAARDPERPLLVTTGDHPMLRADIVAAFCAGSRVSACDVTAGVTPVEVVDRAFPGVRRTALRFRDRGYSGCNLFALMGPRAKDVLTLWQTLEHDRKRPWRMARHLGYGTLARYLAGQLTLDDAVNRLGGQANAKLAAIRLNWAEAARDVDTVADLRLAESVLNGTYAASAAATGASSAANASRAAS
jgi:GTP:adenosylcobinamide-phosphate guanylyltransferase